STHSLKRISVKRSWISRESFRSNFLALSKNKRAPLRKGRACDLFWNSPRKTGIYFAARNKAGADKEHVRPAN
ncbi:MAG: hypothetical protein RR091_11190, partial [Cloacibacillus sp.]